MRDELEKYARALERLSAEAAVRGDPWGVRKHIAMSVWELREAITASATYQVEGDVTE